MAYDETLALRIREALDVHAGVVERKMFGGLAFMVNGNMCCGVMDDRLMVRVGPHAYGDALELPHAGLLNFTGRPMKGSVLVEAEGLQSDDDELVPDIEKLLRRVRRLASLLATARGAISHGSNQSPSNPVEQGASYASH